MNSGFRKKKDRSSPPVPAPTQKGLGGNAGQAGLPGPTETPRRPAKSGQSVFSGAPPAPQKPQPANVISGWDWQSPPKDENGRPLGPGGKQLPMLARGWLPNGMPDYGGGFNGWWNRLLGETTTRAVERYSEIVAKSVGEEPQKHEYIEPSPVWMKKNGEPVYAATDVLSSLFENFSSIEQRYGAKRDPWKVAQAQFSAGTVATKELLLGGLDLFSLATKAWQQVWGTAVIMAYKNEHLRNPDWMNRASADFVNFVVQKAGKTPRAQPADFFVEYEPGFEDVTLGDAWRAARISTAAWVRPAAVLEYLDMIEAGLDPRLAENHVLTKYPDVAWAEFGAELFTDPLFVVDVLGWGAKTVKGFRGLAFGAERSRAMKRFYRVVDAVPDRPLASLIDDIVAGGGLRNAAEALDAAGEPLRVLSSDTLREFLTKAARGGSAPVPVDLGGKLRRAYASLHGVVGKKTNAVMRHARDYSFLALPADAKARKLSELFTKFTLSIFSQADDIDDGFEVLNAMRTIARSGGEDEGLEALAYLISWGAKRGEYTLRYLFSDAAGDVYAMLRQFDRLGGDEFLAMIRGSGSKEEALERVAAFASKNIEEMFPSVQEMLAAHRKRSELMATGQRIPDDIAGRAVLYDALPPATKAWATFWAKTDTAIRKSPYGLLERIFPRIHMGWGPYAARNYQSGLFHILADYGPEAAAFTLFGDVDKAFDRAVVFHGGLLHGAQGIGPGGSTPYAVKAQDFARTTYSAILAAGAKDVLRGPALAMGQVTEARLAKAIVARAYRQEAYRGMRAMVAELSQMPEFRDVPASVWRKLPDLLWENGGDVRAALKKLLEELDGGVVRPFADGTWLEQLEPRMAAFLRTTMRADEFTATVVKAQDRATAMANARLLFAKYDAIARGTGQEHLLETLATLPYDHPMRLRQALFLEQMYSGRAVRHALFEMALDADRLAMNFLQNKKWVHDGTPPRTSTEFLRSLNRWDQAASEVFSKTTRMMDDHFRLPGPQRTPQNLKRITESPEMRWLFGEYLAAGGSVPYDDYEKWKSLYYDLWAKWKHGVYAGKRRETVEELLAYFAYLREHGVDVPAGWDRKLKYLADVADQWDNARVGLDLVPVADPAIRRGSQADVLIHLARRDYGMPEASAEDLLDIINRYAPMPYQSLEDIPFKAAREALNLHTGKVVLETPQARLVEALYSQWRLKPAQARRVGDLAEIMARQYSFYTGLPSTTWWYKNIARLEAGGPIPPGALLQQTEEMKSALRAAEGSFFSQGGRPLLLYGRKNYVTIKATNVASLDHVPTQEEILRLTDDGFDAILYEFDSHHVPQYSLGNGYAVHPLKDNIVFNAGPTVDPDDAVVFARGDELMRNEKFLAWSEKWGGVLMDGDHPKVVYRGTMSPLVSGEAGPRPIAPGQEFTWDRIGAHFSASPDIASRFAAGFYQARPLEELGPMRVYHGFVSGKFYVVPDLPPNYPRSDMHWYQFNVLLEAARSDPKTFARMAHSKKIDNLPEAIAKNPSLEGLIRALGSGDAETIRRFAADHKEELGWIADLVLSGNPQNPLFVESVMFSLFPEIDHRVGREFLEARGFNGVQYINTVDSEVGLFRTREAVHYAQADRTCYIIFNPQQFKSWFNPGRFSPDDPRFMFQGTKGATHWLDDGRAVLTALEGQDVSTAIHELAHVWRRSLADMEPDVLPHMQRQYRERMEVLERFAPNGWDREAEERFARAFERYLYDGQTDIPALKPIFAQIKAWMMMIYQQLAGSEIDTVVSPEIRQAFDALLGGDLNATLQAAGFDEGARAMAIAPVSLPDDMPGPVIQSMPIVDDGTPATFAQVVAAQADPLSEASARILRYIENHFDDIEPLPGGFNPQRLRGLESYLTDRMRQIKTIAAEISQASRKHTILDYGDKRYIELALAHLYPYHYFYTRSAIEWIKRFAYSPHVLGAYGRWRRTLEDVHAGLPEWYKYNVSLNDLPGIEVDNPLYFNLESVIWPLYGITGVDFNDPAKRVNWWTSVLDSMNSFGPTTFAPIQIMTGLYLYLKGRRVADERLQDAGMRWMGRLFPQSSTVKAALNLAGADLPFTQYNEVDPLVSIFGDGLDPYERNRVGRALAAMWQEGAVVNGQVVTQAVAEEAAYQRSGPVWDEAVRRAIVGHPTEPVWARRSTSQLASFFLGVGYKGRSPRDIEVDNYFTELRAVMAMRSMTSPDDFRRAMDAIAAKYPFGTAVSVSRKFGPQRDTAYAYAVLARIPPGKSDDYAKAVGLPADLINRFYDDKGAIERWPETDRDRFMAAIVDMAAILEAPPVATRAEWSRAKSEYSAMIEDGKSRFGSDIWERVDLYYSLRYGGMRDEADRFLEANPEVAEALDWKARTIMASRVMAPYYASRATIENYYAARVRDLIEKELGPDIWEVMRQYYSIQRTGSPEEIKAYKREHPEIKRYYELYYDVYTPQVNDAIARYMAAIPLATGPAMRDAEPAAVGADALREKVETPERPPYEFWQKILPEHLLRHLEAHFLRGARLEPAAVEQLNDWLYVLRQMGLDYYSGEEVLEDIGSEIIRKTQK